MTKWKFPTSGHYFNPWIVELLGKLVDGLLLSTNSTKHSIIDVDSVLIKYLRTMLSPIHPHLILDPHHNILGYIINKPIGTLSTQNRKKVIALHKKTLNLLQGNRYKDSQRKDGEKTATFGTYFAHQLMFFVSVFNSHFMDLI